MRRHRNFILPFLILTLVKVCAVNVAAQTLVQPPLFPITLNQKDGYINDQGEVVIAPKFDKVSNFAEDLAAVYVNSMWGYIDRLGTVVIALRYEMAGNFSEGLAAVRLQGQYGYINGKGFLVIKPQFEKAGSFHEGLARVRRGGNWQYIDRLGEPVISGPYLYIDDFRDGFAIVAKRFENGAIKVAFINKKGKLSPSGWLSAAQPFSEGLAVISKDAHINAGLASGELVFDNFDSSLSFLEPVQYTLINTNGQQVFNGNYQQIGDFADGLAAVRIDNKWGYINRQGKLVIPLQFDVAESFSEGLALVGSGDERYFIDTSGKIVFRATYSVITPFTNGLARVISCEALTCQYQYINKVGKIIWQSAENATAPPFNIHDFINLILSEAA